MVRLPAGTRTALKRLGRFEDRSRGEDDGEKYLASSGKVAIEFGQIVRNRPRLKFHRTHINIVGPVELFCPGQSSHTRIMLTLDGLVVRHWRTMIGPVIRYKEFVSRWRSVSLRQSKLQDWIGGECLKGRNQQEWEKEKSHGETNL
jgi:hypothetical protein